MNRLTDEQSMTSEHLRETLHVSCIADEKFAVGLETTILSILASASGTVHYHFHIVDGGITKETIDRIQRHAIPICENKNISCQFSQHEIPQERLEFFPLRRGSRMAYVKLLFPEIFHDLSEMIYIDVDILVVRGIEDIDRYTNKKHTLLIGALDYFFTLDRECLWLDDVPLEEQKSPYINTGLLWMNLAELRAMNFVQLAIEALQKNSARRFADQSVMNYLCRNRIQLISPKYNYVMSLGSNQPLLDGNVTMNFHYIGKDKPWVNRPLVRNALASTFWHAANEILHGKKGEVKLRHGVDFYMSALKKNLYRIINRKRYHYYRVDFSSMHDPGNTLAKIQHVFRSATNKISV